ncbi:hypothetical protein C0992_010388 [Termitomyces sp. T32_za158]|nr:hypothetical protein C0992_010388 [Termitomyces sp. T32_za158]
MGPHHLQCSRNYEEQLQAAITGITEGTYRLFAEAARELKVNAKTLSNRARRTHQSRQKGFEKQQLLNSEQEEVLLAWADKVALLGQPLSIPALHRRVKDICGIMPGKNWRHCFVR